MDLNDVKVETNNQNEMTAIQITGISSTVIDLINLLKQYYMLVKIQIDLKKKDFQFKELLRDYYQFEEMKLVSSIRANFDKFYVYIYGHNVNTNIEKIRTQFEDGITFLVEFVTKHNKLDDEYYKTLDGFADKLELIIDKLSKKSIYDEWD